MENKCNFCREGNVSASLRRSRGALSLSRCCSLGVCVLRIGRAAVIRGDDGNGACHASCEAPILDADGNHRDLVHRLRPL